MPWLRHVRQRWSIEDSWHGVRDTRLREDAHRYREENGVQILATLRSLAINALRLGGIWSITQGIASLAHDALPRERVARSRCVGDRARGLGRGLLLGAMGRGKHPHVARIRI